jgi:hypothetical protein
MEELGIDLPQKYARPITEEVQLSPPAEWCRRI